MRTLVLFIAYYGSVAYALLDPLYGFLFFVHITIFRPENLVWGDPVFGRLHLMTVIAIIISYLVHRHSLRTEIDGRHQKINLIILALFIVWLAVVSALAEISAELSFDKAMEVMKIFVLCFLFAKLISTRKAIDLYVWVSAVSLALMSFWGILQGLAGNYRLDQLWLGGSNYLAAFLALVAPLMLAKAMDTTLTHSAKMFFLVTTGLVALCCMYTHSRGGFIGLVVGLLSFAMITQQRVRILSGVVLLAICAYPWLPSDFKERIGSVFVEEQERDLSAESRVVISKIALRIWQDHPIAGVGLLNFSPVKETYANKVSDIVTDQGMYDLIFDQERRPHGLYTGMLAETGLVGLALFLTLVLVNLACWFPQVPRQAESLRSLQLQFRGAQAGLLGFSVSAIFGDFQYIEMLYIHLFFIGAVRGYARLQVRTSEGTSDAATLSLAPIALFAAKGPKLS